MTYRLPGILVFAGSTRSGSYNEKLAGAATRVLSGMECDVTRISLADYPMAIYNGDDEERDGPPENAVKLAKLFHQADGIFMASPEYNASVSPLMKNTIDWVSRVSGTADEPIRPYKDKVICLGSASTGSLAGNRGLLHLRASLVNVGALVISEMATLPSAGQAFDDEEELVNERSREFLTNACRSLVEKATLLRRR